MYNCIFCPLLVYLNKSSSQIKYIQNHDIWVRSMKFAPVAQSVCRYKIWLYQNSLWWHGSIVVKVHGTENRTIK